LSKPSNRFYQIIDTTYMHANRILLQLLLKDHRFISQLRTLRVYFLQSQTTFLRHFLDLSHAELRKSTQSASIVKLQSLLDLALSTDSAGSHPELGGVDDVVFRKNLKVTMAESGLYEWLLKIANVSGLTESGSVASTGHKNKEKDDKKPTLGDSLSGEVSCNSLIFISQLLTL
jgi:gamma-tubulin complex component 2